MLSSCNFMSNIFMSCYSCLAFYVLQIHVLQFHTLQFLWSFIFMSTPWSLFSSFHLQEPSLLCDLKFACDVTVLTLEVA